MTQEFFKKDTFSETIPINDVVAWTHERIGESRLILTPIQRSVVWRNSQIINYWDSLLRGYPAGLMMVHRRKDKDEPSRARTLDGKTYDVRAGDFELFDGQQRLTAILLGLGEGQLKDRLKLWVDLGDPSDDSDLLFQLRISSTGQPFGYQPQWPNEKASIPKRLEKTEGWKTANKLEQFVSQNAFGAVKGQDLIDAVHAVPLHEVISLLNKGERPAIENLMRGVDPCKVDSFVRSLEAALELPILFQLINQAVVEDGQEYVRFFGRLGQGGTALTNDELTYSIIKHHFPEVHERMEDITGGAAGRVAGEVNLVLAALRVAKVSAPWKDPDDWQVYGRPHPAFVSRLTDSQYFAVRDAFRLMIPENPGGRLKELLLSIRHRLVYNKTTNPDGLPIILLARLPHQLVDVLLLMESHRQPQEEQELFLPAFVLYWVLFVVDSEKAANIIFKHFCLKADWQPRSDKKLIRFFEKEGASRRLPGLDLLEGVRNEIQQGTHLLRAWSDRFVILDTNKEHPTGDALRALSNDGELIRRALLWLQREYLAGSFPHYDPTSSRDEDLPIDLDHLIPRTKFGEDWRHQQKCLAFTDEAENFRHLRWTVGNSLGNYRWLDASDNRGRKAGKIGEGDGGQEIIDGVPDWNALIGKNPWGRDDVAAFQKMIDLRTVKIYELLLIKGGLNDFVTEPETTLDSKP